jgi:hypothetical protein
MMKRIPSILISLGGVLCETPTTTTTTTVLPTSMAEYSITTIGPTAVSTGLVVFAAAFFN